MTTFKDRRKRIGLTQTELGQVLGMAQASISRMERGIDPVSRRTVLALEALEQRRINQVPLSELLD